VFCCTATRIVSLPDHSSYVRTRAELTSALTRSSSASRSSSFIISFNLITGFLIFRARYLFFRFSFSRFALNSFNWIEVGYGIQSVSIGLLKFGRAHLDCLNILLCLRSLPSQPHTTPGWRSNRHLDFFPGATVLAGCSRFPLGSRG
jgi:hypothetical protein